MKYITYDAQGKILQLNQCPDEMYAMQTAAAGQFHLIDGTSDIANNYVSNNGVLPRLKSTATITGNTITNMINPSTVSINGKFYTINDTTVTLTFPKAGAYNIVVSAWPYLDATFTVTV